MPTQARQEVAIFFTSATNRYLARCTVSSTPDTTRATPATATTTSPRGYAAARPSSRVGERIDRRVKDDEVTSTAIRTAACATPTRRESVPRARATRPTVANA